MTKNIKSIVELLICPKQHWKMALLNNWTDIIGNLAAHVSIETIYDDTIILVVQDSCWMQELHLLSNLILKKINKNLDTPHIKHLRFKQIGIQKKKSIKREKKTVHYAKQVTLSSPEKDALQKIKDPHLSSALEQFLIRCYQENT
ncbi:MAG TPA: DciA family protein [Candidatus Babeliales bacterium]|nr:DciA family protein [Candidatus Babeliales bacterium]